MIPIKLCLALVLFLVVVWQSARSQVLHFGECPSRPVVVSDFNITKYLGDWYENRRHYDLFDLGGKCVLATYISNDDGTITVVNTSRGVLFGTSQKVAGRVTEESPGKLIISFSNAHLSSASIHNYWVLGTDYRTYSVVWRCTQLGILNAQFLWILTREQIPNSATIDKAMAILSANGIRNRRLKVTGQTNC